jgi:hypothetical protein
MLRFVLKFCQKYVIFKYFQEAEIILFLIKNIGYNYFKMFVDIFYSLYWFQIFKIHISIYWN